MLTAKMHSLKDKLNEQSEEQARLEEKEAKALAEESKKKLNKSKRTKEK